MKGNSKISHRSKTRKKISRINVGFYGVSLNVGKDGHTNKTALITLTLETEDAILILI